MPRLVRTAGDVLDDQRGGEVLEYALILGMVSVVAILLIANVGPKLVARWSTVNSSM